MEVVNGGSYVWAMTRSAELVIALCSNWVTRDHDIQHLGEGSQFFARRLRICSGTWNIPRERIQLCDRNIPASSFLKSFVNLLSLRPS